MGLGKTVMTIALILSRPGRSSDKRKLVSQASDEAEQGKKKTDSATSTPDVKGRTLIICPMALLGQWKVRFFITSMTSRKEFCYLGYFFC